MAVTYQDYTSSCVQWSTVYSGAKVLVERRKTEYNIIKLRSSLNYQPFTSEATKPELIKNVIAFS
jgi:hypothetical protein